jgi:hypothetical protein
VRFFVLSPEIEDRNAVEVDNWAKHKKTFYSEWITDNKKIRTWTRLFSFAADNFQTFNF